MGKGTLQGGSSSTGQASKGKVTLEPGDIWTDNLFPQVRLFLLVGFAQGVSSEGGKFLAEMLVARNCVLESAEFLGVVLTL